MNRKRAVQNWMLARLVSPSVRQSAIEDFEEQRQLRAEARGPVSAWCWIWAQIAGLLLEHLKNAPVWSFSLARSYVRVAVRGLRKNKIYSLLNILGLTTGLATFILIALYVQFEVSFDRYHENTGQIYRVVREDYVCSPPPMGPRIKSEFAEVLASARIIKKNDVLFSEGEDYFLEKELFWADPEIFDIFSFKFLQGDPQRALRSPMDLVMSESMAIKYFPEENPIGKSVTIGNNQKFMVAGVFEDTPANSHLTMGLITPLDTYFQVSGNDPTSWSSNYVYTYLLLRRGTDARALEERFLGMEKEIMAGFGMGVPDDYQRTFGIQPITEIHLHSHRQQELSPNSDLNYILLISAIAALVLFIACINYMNLATARSLPRSREVGMRKVVGARRGQLVAQFLGESITFALLALCCSIVVVVLALPSFNTLVERNLSLAPLANPFLYIGILTGTLVVGLLAGIYPAICLSGFRPASVLSRTFTGGPRTSKMRNILVLVQFSVTIVLIISTLTVRDQLMFMQEADLGYSREQIVVMPVRGKDFRRDIETIRTELLRHPDIVAVSLSDSLPNNIETFTSREWTGNDDQEPIPIYYNTADYDFVDLFGIEIVRGRNFSKDFPSDAEGVFLVNEAAVRTAQWDEALGRELTHWRGDKGKIVGVMKDFHFHSLHQPISPLYIFLDPGTVSRLSVKIQSADITATLDVVKDVFSRFSPNYPFEYTFFDDMFARVYKSEQRLGMVFGIFSLLAIVIACLGLLGLAVFTAEQRAQEICIRKVMGASPATIILLLSREFLGWVLVANIIAWPAAYFFMNRWLSDFAYRIEPGFHIFTIAALLAALIAALTVSVQATRSALARPANILRQQ